MACACKKNKTRQVSPVKQVVKKTEQHREAAKPARPSIRRTVIRRHV